jgi:AraC-like DNA-binding protein
MRGRRVAVRGPRTYGNRSLLLATWPKDGLIEMRDGAKVMCVVGGVADLQFGTQLLRCPEGSFIVVPPGVPHPDGMSPHLDAERSLDPNQRCDLLWLSQLDRGLSCWVCHSIGPQHLESGKGEVAFLFSKAAVDLLSLLREEADREDRSVQVCRGLLLALLALVAREAEETAPPYASHKIVAGRDESPQNEPAVWEPIERSKQYIQTHLRNRLTIDKVASVVHLSRTQFVRRFRAETSQSFNEYLTACRLEEAKFLLRKSSWSVERISRSVGLRAPTYFAEMFQRHTGQTPTEYRAACLNAPDRKKSPKPEEEA